MQIVKASRIHIIILIYGSNIFYIEDIFNQGSLILLKGLLWN